jgi:hypothetical protein
VPAVTTTIQILCATVCTMLNVGLWPVNTWNLAATAGPHPAGAG